MLCYCFQALRKMIKESQASALLCMCIAYQLVCVCFAKHLSYLKSRVVDFWLCLQMITSIKVGYTWFSNTWTMIWQVLLIVLGLDLQFHRLRYSNRTQWTSFFLDNKNIMCSSSCPFLLCPFLSNSCLFLLQCYMRQLLTGLHYCHINQVLHRDIKGSC
jgi:hypothetical protein